MRALAIDLGDKRCGIALDVEGLAIPKEIVSRLDIIDVINNYIKHYSDIDTIVVGLPYDLYGKDLKQLEKTNRFIRELKNKYKNLKIVGVDERYTSFEAENVLNSMGEKDTYKKKDDISASLILETYLKGN